MRLVDAGDTALEFAESVFMQGKLPKGVTFKDFIDHSTFDACTRTIFFTVKAVTLEFSALRVSADSPKA